MPRDTPGSPNSRGSGRGNGSGRGRGGQQPRNVQISKAMSFLLRHKAEQEGVPIDEGGWVNVQDVLEWRKLSPLAVNFRELQEVVANDSKQRFSLRALPSPPSSPSHTAVNSTNPSDPSRYLIRAAQGHSLPSISTAALLQPILPTDIDCPSIVVHGTYSSKWPLIRQSGGLKAMSRKHIHFARREPPPLRPLVKGDDRANWIPRGGEGDVSGMRRDCNVVVWVDVKGSMAQGVKWWRGDNGVVLTEGGTGEDGVLGLEWVVCAEKRGGAGDVLHGDRELLRRMKEEQETVGGQMVRDGAGVDLAEINGLRIADGEVDGVEKPVVVKENWDDA